MSITNITKRIAYFYDDRGEFIGKKAFSNVADTFEYSGGRYNVHHDKASYNLIKRWYWNIRCYHYNINNPDPFKFSKTPTPILSPEMYNIQIKTEVAKKLNDLAKKPFALDLKMAIILVIIVAVIVYIATGHKVA